MVCEVRGGRVVWGVRREWCGMLVEGVVWDVRGGEGVGCEGGSGVGCEWRGGCC